MILEKNIQIVEVAGEYLAVPIGEMANNVGGVIALSDSAAFLLKHLTNNLTKDEMLDLLLGEYEVDITTATKDLDRMIKILSDLKVIV